MALENAGALALKDAAAHTSIAFLEPYDEVAVTVPDDLVPYAIDLRAASHGAGTFTRTFALPGHRTTADN